jgi:hypothetical protein
MNVSSFQLAVKNVLASLKRFFYDSALLPTENCQLVTVNYKNFVTIQHSKKITQKSKKNGKRYN